MNPWTFQSVWNVISDTLDGLAMCSQYWQSPAKLYNLNFYRLWTLIETGSQLHGALKRLIAGDWLLVVWWGRDTASQHGTEHCWPHDHLNIFEHGTPRLHTCLTSHSVRELWPKQANKKYKIFPIDSPSSGFPMGKITNHLKQSQGVAVSTTIFHHFPPFNVQS